MFCSKSKKNRLLDVKLNIQMKAHCLVENIHKIIPDRFSETFIILKVTAALQQNSMHDNID
jgi:hypothetical protein